MILTLDLPPELEQFLQERAAASGHDVGGFVRQLLEKELQFPQKVDDFPTIGTEAWGLMNRRRAELIRKKNRQGLTPEEWAEYERLQRLSQAALEKTFPGSPADDKRLDRLEARLRAEAPTE